MEALKAVKVTIRAADRSKSLRKNRLEYPALSGTDPELLAPLFSVLFYCHRSTRGLSKSQSPWIAISARSLSLTSVLSCSVCTFVLYPVDFSSFVHRLTGQKHWKKILLQLTLHVFMVCTAGKRWEECARFSHRSLGLTSDKGTERISSTRK